MDSISPNPSQRMNCVLTSISLMRTDHQRNAAVRDKCSPRTPETNRRIRGKQQELLHIKRFTVIRAVSYAIRDTPPIPLQKTSEFAECSHSAKYLIKPMENQHFRVRMSLQHGPYPDASTKRSRGSGHMLLPRWRTHATQEARSGSLCLNRMLSLGPRE